MRRLTDEEFSNLLTRFERTAFRYEGLDEYRVSAEKEALALFSAGQPQPDWHRDRLWTQSVRELTQQGKVMERVHIIDGPLTSYLRFEIEWGYTSNASAGERIYIKEGPKPPTCDFWLIDDSTVVLMQYDNEGNYLGAEMADAPSHLRQYQEYRESILKGALPLSDYLQRMHAKT